MSLTATSEDNCHDTFTYQMPEADAGADTTISQGYPTLLTAMGGTGYRWFPTEGLSNSNAATPLQTTILILYYYSAKLRQYQVLCPEPSGQKNYPRYRMAEIISPTCNL